MRAALLSLVLLSGPAVAQAPASGGTAGGPRHAGNAPSSYAVRPAPQGAGAAVSWRNVRYEPFGASRGGRRVPYLLTIVTTNAMTIESEGSTGRVAVTVDDLSGPRARRVAAFAEAGNAVAVLRDAVLVVTTPGCCAAGTVRSVRRLPDGRPLFRSTGPGETGISAFVLGGRGDTTVNRWMAYDGMPEGAEPGVIGVLTYGGDDGPIARLALRLTADEAEVTGAEYGLRDRGVLLIVAEGQTSAAPHDRPRSVGMPGFGGTAVTEAGVTQAGPFAFSVRLTDGDGKTVAEIPVEDDRPVPGRATLAPGYSLVPAPARAPMRTAR